MNAEQIRSRTLEQLADNVDRLTEPMHVQRVEADGHTRTITLPCLLDQLADSLHPSGNAEAGGGGYESRPPLRTDAVDAILEAERDIDHWTNALGLTTRHSLSSDLRQILGTVAGASDVTLWDVAADVRRIVTIVATVTDWESLPWRPNGLCPVCTRRGTLRVRASTETAFCTGCRSHWTPDTLPDLAEAVRSSNEQEIPA